MKPKCYRAHEHARRWAAVGGVGLSCESGVPKLFAPANISEPAGWFRHWLAKAGIVFCDIQGRGECIEWHRLTAAEYETLAAHSTEPREQHSHHSNLTTVVFFSGTRNGTTGKQREAVSEFLACSHVTAAHHGCCIGADDDFNRIVGSLRRYEATQGRTIVIHGYPADVPEELRGTTTRQCNFIALPAEPLARNVRMAELAATLQLDYVRGSRVRPVLVACPKEDERPDHNRGGTWHAVRHFVNRGVRTAIFYASGRAEYPETNT